MEGNLFGVFRLLSIVAVWAVPAVLGLMVVALIELDKFICEDLGPFQAEKKPKTDNKVEVEIKGEVPENTPIG
jgi:hypothetical protein